MEEFNKATKGGESPLIVEGMSPLDVLLARLDLTQGEFCEAMAVSRSSYKRWRENGVITKLNHRQVKTFDSLLRSVGLSFQDLPDDVKPFHSEESA
jgi:hypothetical protein